MATPEERRLAARTGWVSRQLKGDLDAIAARARRGIDEKFRQKADPDGVLNPRELERKVGLEKRLHYARLAQKSANVRRARKRRGGSTDVVRFAAELLANRLADGDISNATDITAVRRPAWPRTNGAPID